MSNDLEKIHFEFGETWRVADNETEFTYENGESYQVKFNESLVGQN